MIGRSQWSEHQKYSSGSGSRESGWMWTIRNKRRRYSQNRQVLSHFPILHSNEGAYTERYARLAQMNAIMRNRSFATRILVSLRRALLQTALWSLFFRNNRMPGRCTVLVQGFVWRPTAPIPTSPCTPWSTSAALRLDLYYPNSLRHAYDMLILNIVTSTPKDTPKTLFFQDPVKARRLLPQLHTLAPRRRLVVKMGLDRCRERKNGL